MWCPRLDCVDPLAMVRGRWVPDEYLGRDQGRRASLGAEGGRSSLDDGPEVTEGWEGGMNGPSPGQQRQIPQPTCIEDTTQCDAMRCRQRCRRSEETNHKWTVDDSDRVSRVKKTNLA